MKVLLLYPKYPETFWSFKNVLKFISKKVAFPPLGLLTVAAMLPENWKKKLVDLNLTELKDEEILWADMVFISAMLIQEESVREVVRRCNSLNVKTVAGGPAFNILHDNFQGIDHFVLNEAEVTLPLFLEDLKNNRLKHIYTSDIHPPITRTPIPMWSLIDFRYYSTIGIQYSRGCPFNCEFCDIIIMNGQIPRTKTPEQVIMEVQSIFDAGWRGPLFIVDDNFIGNKKEVKEMLPLLIKWQKEHGYPFRLLTEASVNMADDEELLQLMRESNFNKVFLGIETPEVNSLVECGKFQNTNGNIEDSVKKIQEFGMQVMGGFIVGFDQDPENIFERQIDFIQRTGIVTAMVGLLNALPGTRLWKRLESEGRIIQVSGGENTDGTLNFMPKMGKDMLLEGYKKIIATIYSPKKYYQRIDTFLKNYKPSVKAKLTYPEFQAFIKSIWQIGIRSGARFEYWKLLIKIFFTRIRALPAAIELAIFGLHFERMAENLLCSQDCLKQASAIKKQNC